jgi:hypothetical protein
MFCPEFKKINIKIDKQICGRKKEYSGGSCTPSVRRLRAVCTPATDSVEKT